MGGSTLILWVAKYYQKECSFNLQDDFSPAYASHGPRPDQKGKAHGHHLGNK